MAINGTRAVVVTGVLVALVGGLGASPAGTAASRGACKPKGLRVIAKGPTGRVFEKPGRVPSPSGGTGGAVKVLGCLYKVKKWTLLGYDGIVDGEYEWISRKKARIAGRYAAYAHFFGGLDGGEFLDVVDLRTHDRVYRTIANGLVTVYSIALAPTGAVAWIDRYDSIHVNLWSPANGWRRVDSGPDIHRRSLVLSGETVTWTNGGTQKSARLD
jgi:hypothetical protein